MTDEPLSPAGPPAFDRTIPGDVATKIAAQLPTMPSLASPEPQPRVKPDISKMGPGQAFVETAIDKGEDAGQVHAWASSKMKEQIEQGAPVSDVEKFWGVKTLSPDPVSAAVAKDQFSVADFDQAMKLPLTSDATTAVLAGWGHSTDHLLLSGKPPYALNPDASWFDRALYSSAQFVGDLPGFMAGFGIVAATTKNPYGAMAAGAALNEGARSAAMRLMRRQNEEGGPPLTRADILENLAGTAWDAAKAGAETFIGAKVAGPVADIVGGAVGQRLGSKFAGIAAGSAAGAAAFTAGQIGAGAVLGDQLPDAKDFMVMLPIAILGSWAGHAVGSGPNKSISLSPAAEAVASNSMDIFADTGIGPREQLILAQADPAFRTALMSSRMPDGTMNPKLGLWKKQDPPPAVPPKPPAVTAQTEETAAAKPAAIAPLHTVTPEPTPPVVFGDSIGEGIRNAGKLTGDTQVGRNPQAVLNAIQSSRETLAGQSVVLSSGASNNIDMIDYVPQQIAALEHRGVAPDQITLLGVGDREDFQAAKVNEKLQAVAEKAGVKFQPINPGMLGPDRVHPADYKPLLGPLGHKVEAEPPTHKGIDGSDSGTLHPEAPAPEQVEPKTPAELTPDQQVDIFYQLEHPGQGSRRLGDGTPEATSPAGARGGMQIMPATARQYGLDPDQLGNPEYDRYASKIILADLSKQFDGNLQDMAVAYNAGPGMARSWIKAGRPVDMLPLETQRYVEHLERLTGADYGHTERLIDQASLGGGDHKWEPPAETDAQKAIREDWYQAIPKTSNLPIDEAQSAPKNNDYDVPDLAGSSKDNTTFYFDKSLPATISDGSGHDFDPRPFLTIHEHDEHVAMEGYIRHGMSDEEAYHKAHTGVATPNELRAVAAAGYDPAGYQRALVPFIQKAGEKYGRADINAPPDLYEKVYPHTEHEELDRSKARRGIGSTTTEQAGVTPTEASYDNPRWALFDKDTKDVRSAYKLPNGKVVPAPELIAGYLQKFGDLAGFKFLSGPAQANVGDAATPSFVQATSRINGRIAWQARHVYMPQTPDDVMKAWYGLGRYEVLYHEVGHAIDNHLNGGSTTSVIPNGPIREEIIAASKSFRPKLWGETPDYNMQPSELMADAIGKWLSDPTARARMPEFTKKYGAKLQPFVDIANQALPKNVGNKWVPPEEPTEAAGGSGPGAATGGAGGKPPGPPRQPPAGGPNAPQGPKKIPTDFNQYDRDGFELDKIVADGPNKGFIPTWMQNARKAAASFFGELKPARDLDRALGTQKEHLAEHLLRMTYSARQKAMSFYYDGTLKLTTKDAYGNPTGNVEFSGDASMRKAYQQVQEDGGDMRGFWRTRIAARAAELSARGIETGVDPDVARRWLEHPDTLQHYDRAMRTVTASDEAQVNFYHDAGMLSEEGKNKLLQDNMFHIPWIKFVDPDARVPTIGRGFLPRQMLKKIEGHEHQIVNPASTELSNKTMMMGAALRNIAWRGITDKIAEVNGQNPSGKLLIDFKPVKTDFNDVGKPLEGDIIDGNGNVISAKERENVRAIEAWAKVEKSRGPGDFPVWKDGKVVMWHTDDPDLAQLIERTNGQQAAVLSKALTKVASWERAGVIGQPDQQLRSIVHQQLGASLFAAHGPTIPFQDIISSAFSYFNGSWEGKSAKALADGAIISIIQQDTGLLEKAKAAFDDTNTWSLIPNVVRHPIDALRIMQHQMTKMSEVGMHARLSSQGMSGLDAGMFTRKAHLDYAEKFQSQFVSTWASWTGFMTTGFKDWGQVIDAIRNRPVTTAAKISAGLVFTTAANYLWQTMRDKDRPLGQRFVDIPQAIRDNYWIVGDDFFKIRKPWVASVFPLMTERLLAHFNSEDPADYENTAKGWINSLLQQTAPQLVPTAAKPLEIPLNIRMDTVDSMLNARPLVPGRLQHLSSFMQYEPDTSELSKFISRATRSMGMGDLSPMGLDRFIEDMVGPLPLTITKGLGSPFKGSGGAPKDLADLPFVGSFFVRHQHSSAWVNEFYKQYDAVAAAHADMKSAIEQGDVKLEAATRANPYLMQVTKLGLAVRATEKAIREIDALPTITEDQAKQGVHGMTDQEKIKQTDSFMGRLAQVSELGVKTIAGHVAQTQKRGSIGQ